MRKKILFVASLLFGLMFIYSGLNKFFQFAEPPKDMPREVMEMFGGFMQIKWLMPLIGVAEIVGGILLITNKYRALGALIIFPVMVGILLTHMFVEPTGLPIALALFAILVWAIVENREKYYPLVR